MAVITSIRNLDDTRISIYRSLKGKDLDKDGVFIAEGDKVIRSLLESRLKIASALMTGKWLNRLRKELNKKTRRHIHVYIIGQKEMERVVGFNLHQGLMMAVKTPPRLSLERAWRFWRSPHLLLAVDRIKDTENMGLIVRNSVAFGVDALLVDKNSCNPYLRRAVRVSVGNVFKIPVVHVNRLSTAFKWLRQKFRTRIVAASPNIQNKNFSEADFSGNICLVLGSEDYGLSEEVFNSADSVIRIPISKKVDSLNVSCASAIILHQAAAGRKIV